MQKEILCIVCPRGCRILVDDDGDVTGASCPRGTVYAKQEAVCPMRQVSSTVCVRGALHARLPVKTEFAIPLSCTRQAVQMLNGIVVEAPVRTGQVIIKNICDTGVSWIAARSMERMETEEEKP